MCKNGGFFCLFLFGLFGVGCVCVGILVFCLGFLLKFSANFVQCCDLVLCDEKLHASLEAKLLGREGPDCIKN